MTKAIAKQPVIVQAPANIALIKYWGKRTGCGNLNLPATGSLSITLSDLLTTTKVELDQSLQADAISLNGIAVDEKRIHRFLDHVRSLTGEVMPYCRIESSNNFPTAAGLASSASGYAALAMAASKAYGLSLDRTQLSGLARIGSGSAARSMFGGFVLMHRGIRDDGSDAFAEPLLDATAWPLEVVIAIVTTKAKAHSSTVGMNHTMATSPYYAQWIEHNEARLVQAKKAVLEKDFECLGALSEASALQMHASAMAAEPGVLYWQGATMECMHRIRQLRGEGVPVFFTIDAGPQVKAVTLPGHASKVRDALADISGIEALEQTTLGAGARVL